MSPLYDNLLKGALKSGQKETNGLSSLGEVIKVVK